MKRKLLISAAVIISGFTESCASHQRIDKKLNQVSATVDSIDRMLDQATFTEEQKSRSLALRKNTKH